MDDEKLYPVFMPKWGLSMTEGELVEWHIQEGQPIDAGGLIADVETEKIVNSIEVEEAGFLMRQLVKPGTVVGVGDLLGVVATSTDIDSDDIEQFIKDYSD